MISIPPDDEALDVLEYGLVAHGSDKDDRHAHLGTLIEDAAKAMRWLRNERQDLRGAITQAFGPGLSIGQRFIILERAMGWLPPSAPEQT